MTQRIDAARIRAFSTHQPSHAEMFRSPDQFIPADDVVCVRRDDATVLTTPHNGERRTLSPTGEEVWALLQARHRTIDRLVMTIARRSSGQALSQVPDRVMEELNAFVGSGMVHRVAVA